jgi:hypothetical protein
MEDTRSQIRRAMYRVLGTWAAADHLISSMERANDRSLDELLTDCANTPASWSVRKLTPAVFGEHAAKQAISSDIDGAGISDITSASIIIPPMEAA